PPSLPFRSGGGDGQAGRSSSCRDVGSDNGALAIIPSGKRSEVAERVEAGVVSAFKPDLQRVLADQGYVLNAQLLIGKLADAREPARRAGLAATFGARACPAQLLTRVGALGAALPGDVHHLGGAVDVHGDRKRVW